MVAMKRSHGVRLREESDKAKGVRRTHHLATKIVGQIPIPAALILSLDAVFCDMLKHMGNAGMNPGFPVVVPVSRKGLKREHGKGSRP